MKWMRVVAAVAVRPRLWPVAARQTARLARPGWWRRPPFLPVPDRGYARFRLVTQYGGAGDRAPEAADVLNYLAWCKWWR
jgi:hypothetical protein